MVFHLYKSLQIFIFTYFCTRCPLRKSHIICIQKAPHSNEVNFNICPHTNTKWKTRCRFCQNSTLQWDIYAIDIVIQNFKNLMACTFHHRKKTGRRFLVQTSDG